MAVTLILFAISILTLYLSYIKTLVALPVGQVCMIIILVMSDRLNIWGPNNKAEAEELKRRKDILRHAGRGIK